MSNTAPQLESLIQSLKAGTPRAAYLARRELSGLGRAAEAPLIHLLREVKDSHRICDILSVLQEVRLSDAGAVDAVVGLLSHKATFVRAAAARCLLVSSPKLRRVLARIRAAHAAEKHEGVLATLQKLLDRYPGGAA
jgi:hypothetical protein